MKKLLIILIALLGWFAVITQYILMLENRIVPIGEATIRFFSYFTILTNILVAWYFSYLTLRPKTAESLSLMTPITVYITMVGLVYQVLLRHVWEPKGMQQLVDELLHSVIPLLVILFWGFYKSKADAYSKIIKWAIYPLAYLFYILIRGSFSGFYPYPFIDVANLGMTETLTNAGFMVLFFVLLASLLLFIGNKKQHR